MQKSSISVPRFILVLGIIISAFCLWFAEFVSPRFWVIFWYLINRYDTAVALIMLPLTVGAAIVVYLLTIRKTDPRWDEKILCFLKNHFKITLLFYWLLLCLSSLLIYHNHPLSMDEFAPFFQAKIFAAFQLHGAYPTEWLNYLIPPPNQNYFLNVNPESGAVMSAYWPGFALLLTPFVWLNIPWICNPTITVIGLWFIAKITAILGNGKTAATWAVLFALASPVFAINGISYYSMSAHLLFNLIFLYIVLQENKKLLILAGGIGGFAMVLHNPVPHVLFALPWVFYLGKKQLTNWLYLGTGYVFVFGILGIGWSFLTSSIMSVSTYLPTADIETTGNGLLKPLSIFLSLIQLPSGSILLAREAGLVKTWLWTTPFIPALAMFAGFRKFTLVPTYSMLMLFSLLLTFFGYFMIPFDQGHGWGYRYLHSAWALLPILAALVIDSFDPGVRLNRAFLNGLMLVSIISLLILLPLRMYQTEDFVSFTMEQRPPRIQSASQVCFHNGFGYYSTDNIQNDPWLRDNKVTLLIPPDETTIQEIAEHFLNKPIIFGENEFGFTLISGAKPNDANSLN